MERASSNTEKSSGKPTLSADGKSMTFAGRVFHRCADGTFRENRSSRPKATRRAGGKSSGGVNEMQRLRIELEVAAG